MAALVASIRAPFLTGSRRRIERRSGNAPGDHRAGTRRAAGRDRVLRAFPRSGDLPDDAIALDLRTASTVPPGREEPPESALPRWSRRKWPVGCGACSGGRDGARERLSIATTFLIIGLLLCPAAWFSGAFGVVAQTSFVVLAGVGDAPVTVCAFENKRPECDSRGAVHIRR